MSRATASSLFLFIPFLCAFRSFISRNEFLCVARICMFHESALVVVSFAVFEPINNEICADLLEKKWTSFARRIFRFRALQHFIALLAFTIALVLRPSLLHGQAQAAALDEINPTTSISIDVSATEAVAVAAYSNTSGIGGQDHWYRWSLELLVLAFALRALYFEFLQALRSAHAGQLRAHCLRRFFRLNPGLIEALGSNIFRCLRLTLKWKIYLRYTSC